MLTQFPVWVSLELHRKLLGEALSTAGSGASFDDAFGRRHGRVGVFVVHLAVSHFEGWLDFRRWLKGVKGVLTSLKTTPSKEDI